MARGIRWLTLSLALIALRCQPRAQPTPPPAEAPAELSALTGASILIAAGDIAECGSQADERTAILVDSLLKADSAAGVEDRVAALGDNAYPRGAAEDYVRCFTPSWGDSNKSIMKVIRPTPGNHEHVSEMATPYYVYFGDRAGSPRRGYYSYDLGDWHIVVLNSEMLVNSGFSADETAEQLKWLENDLARNRKTCSLAYWHHPRWSSGWHGSDPRIDAFWQPLYNGGVDVILNGHDHHYERFVLLNPAGAPDGARGMAEFVVGTGGGRLRGLTRRAPNSDFRLQGHFGVLKLTLGADQYQWAFLDTEGRVWDPGAGRCHDATSDSASR